MNAPDPSVSIELKRDNSSSSDAPSKPEPSPSAPFDGALPLRSPPAARSRAAKASRHLVLSWTRPCSTCVPKSPRATVSDSVLRR